MTDLILWNSVAGRRRSPGDTFLENGLALIETHLRERGYEVEVVDWARDGVWQEFTPQPLARVCSRLAGALVPPVGVKPGRRGLWKKLLSLVFLFFQEIMTRIQRRRRRRMINALARRVKESGCRVLGIKTWYGEAFTAALDLAREVRSLAPGVLIVAGGPHVSIYREAVIRAGEFDLAVAGSGEHALNLVLETARQVHNRGSLLALLAAEVRKGRLGNSVLRLSGSLIQAPETPESAGGKTVPRYSIVQGKTMIHVIVDSIGCPWGQCNFCVHSNIYPRYSARPAVEVVDEMQTMLAGGIGIFRFSGSSTTLDQARRIAELVLERNLRLVFSMFARGESGIANSPEIRSRVVESFRVLLKAGLRAVFIGAESGSDTANENVMNKGARREDVIATVQAMREASVAEGIPLDIGISLIFPVPTLGRFALEELAADNLSLVTESAPDSVLVSPPAPFPGTAWFDESARFGFELGEKFVRDMLEYDYVLYKPPSLWPDLGLKLEGRDLRSILADCQRMRQSLEERGFITEVTDEHFLMLRAAGYEGREGAASFKRLSLIGLLSCDYRWMTGLQEAVNRRSREIAETNNRIRPLIETGT